MRVTHQLAAQQHDVCFVFSNNAFGVRRISDTTNSHYWQAGGGPQHACHIRLLGGSIANRTACFGHSAAARAIQNINAEIFQPNANLRCILQSQATIDKIVYG